MLDMHVKNKYNQTGVEVVCLTPVFMIGGKR